MEKFVILDYEEVCTDVSEEQFWKGVGVWVRSPHVANRRLCGVQTILCGRLLEPENTDSVIHQLSKVSRDQPVVQTDLEAAQTLLTVAGIKLQSIDNSEFEMCNGNSVIFGIRKLLPKNGKVFQSCLEAILLDGPGKQASFIHLGPAESSSSNTLSPRMPYCYRMCQNQEDEGTTLELGIWKWNEDVSLINLGENWLRTNLFPRLVKWVLFDRSPTNFLPEGSLGLVDLGKYNEKYQELKTKYGPQMVEIWPEQTDPLKFVYEDLAIASYLLCLWDTKEEERKPSFVDLGCGNGLLTHLLCSEGHPGLGLDVRSRKLWALFPDTTCLKVCTVVPSAETTFPEYDWIIGNHSDELTPWIPVMAALSSPFTNFFVLPCCAHDFWGKYQRCNTSNSQYTEYIGFVKTVGQTCGFNIEVDKLRIPSTKRTCLIGRSRNKNMDKTLLWEYVESRKQIGQEEFTPRAAHERVRNCTKLPAGVAESVVKIISRKLLIDVPHKKYEEWQVGQKLPLVEAAQLIEPALKLQMKSECGGLQTLLKNHHNIFLVQGGTVQLRKPVPSECTDPARWKNKVCWFHSNHPQGCPLDDNKCSYEHTFLEVL